MNCFKSLNFIHLVVFGFMGTWVVLGCSASSSEEDSAPSSPGSPVKSTLSSQSSTDSAEQPSLWFLDQEGRLCMGLREIDPKSLVKPSFKSSPNGIVFSLRRLPPVEGGTSAH